MSISQCSNAPNIVPSNCRYPRFSLDRLMATKSYTNIVHRKLLSWQNLRQTELCGSMTQVILPLHTHQRRTFPSYSQILVCLFLINSASLSLMTP